MKKVSRFAIAIGAVLILIGLVWSGFSWHRISGDIQHIGQKDYTAQQATFDSASIRNIKVNISDVGVTIKPQTGSGQVRVDYFKTKENLFKVTGSDGTVSVSRSDSSPIDQQLFCFFRCLSSPSAITIYVPADSSYGYDLTADNAPVVFNAGSKLHTKSVRIVSSDSRVALQNLTIDGTADLSSDNGSIWLQDIMASDKLSLRSSDASTVLTRVQAPDITSKTDNGSTRLDHVTATDLTANTSDASILLIRLTASHVTLTSDNGGISGSIIGSKDDFDSRISSDNGSIHIDGVATGSAYFSGKGKHPKSLTARASDASVNIQFVK